VLAVECDLSRIEKRLKTKYLDKYTHNLEEALAWINESCSKKEPLSVAVLGNAAELFPQLIQLGATPALVTDQTSAHDPLNGYLPAGWSLEHYAEMKKSAPEQVIYEAKKSMAAQVGAMLEFQKRGIPVFDYGNNIRQMAFEAGEKNSFDFEGFVPAYIRPLFCEGIGPFRWVALSGDPEDIYATDEMVKKLIPDNEHLHQWLTMAREKIAFQGLPARICWVGLKDRARKSTNCNWS
jgi:urocanate hydratase